MGDDERLMNVYDLAAYLNVAVRTIYNMRSEGRLPDSITLRVSRSLRWRKKDIDNWLEQQKGNTDE